ncbi:MAG: hypothetical protein JOZ39_06175 [Chloroflexi bacterium]|nr:hypothetical protein [Chloroflexota bacterium]
MSMLHSVELPGLPPIYMAGGAVSLEGTLGRQVAAAVGYALFDAGSGVLGRSGEVAVDWTAPLDGRRYIVRRAVDVPEHWQVQDAETGWTAASGSIECGRWQRRILSVPEEWSLADLFTRVVAFSLPVTLAWLEEGGGQRDREFARMLRLDGYREAGRAVDREIEAARAVSTGLREAEQRLIALDSQFERRLEGARIARERELASAARCAELRQQLDREQARVGRLSSLEAELAATDQEGRAALQMLAVLDSRAAAAAGWQATKQRAAALAAEHEPHWSAYEQASAAVARFESQLAGSDAIRSELTAAQAAVLALQREQGVLEQRREGIRQAEEAAAELTAQVNQQQVLQNELSVGQERAIRLELVNRALQLALAESKRLEVLLAETDRQITELEPLSQQPQRLRAIEEQLEQAQSQLREANRRSEQAHVIEAAMRSIGASLDDLRKGTAVTGRLALSGSGNGAGAGEERGAGHLREAVDHQIEALERQIREWQAQLRDLSPAAQQVNQLRSAIHQIEQELAAGRKQEVRLGALPALRQHAKNLRDRLDQLKQSSAGLIKEQQECADTARRLPQLRKDLTMLNDPRAAQLGWRHVVAAKDEVDAELRRVAHELADRSQRQQHLEREVEALTSVEHDLAEARNRAAASHQGYCTHLAQRAIVELAAGASQEFDGLAAEIEHQRGLLADAQRRQTSQRSELSELARAPAEVAACAARLDEAEAHRTLCQELAAQADQELAGVQANRAELQAARAELAADERATELMMQVGRGVREIEAAMGAHLRGEVAALGSAILSVLMPGPEARMSWRWGEPPELSSGGSARSLQSLSAADQVRFILALRLAVVAQACRLGSAIVGGAETLRDRSGLDALPGFDQLLLLSA